jgi:hypothetical protein
MWRKDKYIRIYLASLSTIFSEKNMKYVYKYKPLYILESIFYVKEYIIKYKNSSDCKGFMLDSGAFTFMGSKKTKNANNIDWKGYTQRYIDYINHFKIELFFEIDIDNVIGYNNVKLLRKTLEQGTNKKCIPVWHKARGKEEFIYLCKNYDYIAIGGIVSNEIKRTEWKYFKWFINTAHENNCMIHGLGFTPKQDKLKLYNFDSVDSTNWLAGQRYARMEKTIGNAIYCVKSRTKNKRVKDHGYKLAQQHNLQEWIKFQKYMEKI